MTHDANTDLPHTSPPTAPSVPPKSHPVTRPESKSDAEVARKTAEGPALPFPQTTPRLFSEQETRRL